MSDEEITKNDISLFKSVWGILTIIVAIIGLGVSVMSFVFKTFPTNSDIDEKFKNYISKQEYFQQEPYNKKVLGIEEALEKYKEQNSKGIEKELGKARIEAKTERLHLLSMLINIADRKIIQYPDDKSLKEFREELCKEYNRVRSKLDNNLKELE
jgi:hypothetical protein